MYIMEHWDSSQKMFIINVFHICYLQFLYGYKCMYVCLMPNKFMLCYVFIDCTTDAPTTLSPVMTTPTSILNGKFISLSIGQYLYVIHDVRSRSLYTHV